MLRDGPREPADVSGCGMSGHCWSGIVVEVG
jgi:hypothetical protein